MEEHPFFHFRPNCEVCGSSDHRILQSKPYADDAILPFLRTYYEGKVDESMLQGAIYEIAECTECGFMWQTWILKDEGMVKLYSQWIDPHVSEEKKNLTQQKLAAGFKKEMILASGFVKRGEPVLDVGMGWAYWASFAKNWGFDVYGTEIADDRKQNAEKLGIKIVDQNNLPQNFFRYMNSEQSMEHIPNPIETMKALSASLAPGGVLRIAVPNAGKIKSRIVASDWHAQKDVFHPLEHINCFSHKSLTRLGQEVGLRVVTRPVLHFLRYGPKQCVTACIASVYSRFFGTTLLFQKPTL